MRDEPCRILVLRAGANYRNRKWEAKDSILVPRATRLKRRALGTRMKVYPAKSSSLFAFAQKTSSGLWRNLRSTCRQVYQAPCAALRPESRNARRPFIARDLYKGHMTIMRSRHGNSIAEWWKSFLKKDVLEYSKQQNKKVACVQPPPPLMGYKKAAWSYFI